MVSGAENAKLGGWMNSTPALILNVQRQPGANVVDTVDRIQELLPSLRAAMPAGVDVTMTGRGTDLRLERNDRIRADERKAARRQRREHGDES